MASGTLIAESLRPGVALEGLTLNVTRIFRRGPLSNLAPGQPNLWTFIEFTLADSDAGVLADQLAAALTEEGAWYCDFRSATETLIVFAGRVFRYPRGDLKGREEAVAYAQSHGVPKRQLDWPA